jgi:hypothetical protein
MSDTKTVQITVFDVPVLVVPGAQRVRQGSTLTFTVTTSQAAANLPITITASNLPQGAVVAQSGNSAQFRWTPGLNTATGNYTVTFRATSSGALAVNESRNVTITVDPYIIPLRPSARSR